ncbi:Fatty-acid-CoA ligase FadD6, partial [Blyttiomyces sp. JEL0837]
MIITNTITNPFAVAIIAILIALAFQSLSKFWQRWNISRELWVVYYMAPVFVYLYVRKTLGLSANSIQLFMKTVRAFPDKPALIYTGNGRTYTFRQLNDVADPSVLIYSSVHENDVDGVRGELSDGVRYYTIDVGGSGNGGKAGLKSGFAECLDVGSFTNPSEPNAKFANSVKADDIAMLIYTSGTSGKPKPAAITHARFYLGSSIFNAFSDVAASDRLYTCLPLYHASAAVAGIGSTITCGCTCVLAPKFSASNFIKDCAKYDVTVIQYIGELIRFLLTTPPSPTDSTSHKIRMAIGNGLRSDIWSQFKSRFNIPTVVEFYAATEGNANMVNRQMGSVGLGAVGRMGPLAAMGLRIQLVKWDRVLEEPVRGSDGFCVLCEAGEDGELISEISRGSLVRDFKGYYKNSEESDKKVLKGVFRKGDEWFRTGDILRRDDNFYYYFVDRIGDSFRWKGENVSTTEVSEAITGFPNIIEVNVYGVQVPNTEGRAGMAFLTVRKPVNVNSSHGNVDDILDLKGLFEVWSGRLPKYAVPVWIRVRVVEEGGDASMHGDSHTGTFKQVKGLYKNEGFNPDVVKEKMFW